MASYDVQDPTTGKSLTVEGDSPPTEQELNDIFSQVHGTAQQPGGQAIDQVTKGVSLSPLGMAAQGANSIGEGFGKVTNAFPINIPQPIQKGAQSLFNGARSLGVGVARNMTGQSPLDVTRGTIDSFQGKAPQDAVDKAGSYVGENAPVIAAGVASPSLGGPLAMMAQQAQSGKVSPVPFLAGAAAKGIEAVGPKIVQKASSMFQPVAEKTISTLFNTPEEAVKARFENPEAIKNAATISDLTHKLPESLSILDKQISEGDKAAWDTLSKSYNSKEMGYAPEDRAIPKETVQNALDSAKKELSVYGGGLVGKAAKQAASTISDLSDDIANVGKFSGGKIKSLLGVDSALPKNNFLPETTIKGIIQSLDQNINWDIKEAEPVNNALEKARITLDDMLKKQNPEYEKAMAPVAEKMALLKDVKKQFNIRSGPEGYAPGTATEGNLSNLLKNNKSITQETLNRLKTHTGIDFVSQVQNAKNAEAFQPGGSRPNGSRMTNLGRGVGAGIGGTIGIPLGPKGIAIGAMGGQSLGGVIGAYFDRNGGAMSGKLIDFLSKNEPALLQEIQSKVKEVPSEAMSTAAGSQVQQNPTKQPPEFHALFPDRPKPRPLFRKAS